jgi:hypothetical protein
MNYDHNRTARAMTDPIPVYPTPPTAEQAAWLADPPPGDWLHLVATDQVPGFMWDGIDRAWLDPERWKLAAALGRHWFPRPTIESLALTFSCPGCHADVGEPCHGKRTHKLRLRRAIRPWNRAVADAPYAEHRTPGRCYVDVPVPTMGVSETQWDPDVSGTHAARVAGDQAPLRRCR